MANVVERTLARDSPSHRAQTVPGRWLRHGPECKSGTSKAALNDRFYVVRARPRGFEITGVTCHLFSFRDHVLGDEYDLDEPGNGIRRTTVATFL